MQGIECTLRMALFSIHHCRHSTDLMQPSWSAPALACCQMAALVLLSGAAWLAAQ